MAFEVVGASALFGVYDMPASVRFYRDLLGFEVVSSSPARPNGFFHWCLLRLGGGELMLNTNFEFDDERPAEPDRARNTAHGDVCVYFGCPDVDAAYETLRARGVAVKTPEVTRYGMKQMYLRDPDGYGLCFQWQVES